MLNNIPAATRYPNSSHAIEFMERGMLLATAVIIKMITSLSVHEI
jgi:hypothetical protein